MSRRKRKYIPQVDKLAAALACLLPSAERDILRHHPDYIGKPNKILRMFEWDHVVLHAWSGSDSWENLDPKLKEEHREKSRADTSRAAKAVRIDDKWNAFMRNLKAGRKPPPLKLRKTKWPKRKMRSR